MSDHQVILEWLKSIDSKVSDVQTSVDAKIGALQASLVECQGRHRVAAAVQRVGGTRKAKLIKAVALLATAAAGFIAERLLGN